MTKLGNIISFIISIFTNIGALLITVMMLHISLDVVLRFFGISLGGTIEIVSNYYMIIIGFLSLSFTEEKNRQIAVELVTTKMPRVVQKHLAAFALVVSFTVFGFLMVRSYAEAVSKHRVGASVVEGTTQIPIWPAYYVVPFGCALILVVLAYKLLIYLTGKPSGLNERLDIETL